MRCRRVQTIEETGVLKDVGELRIVIGSASAFCRNAVSLKHTILIARGTASTPVECANSTYPELSPDVMTRRTWMNGESVRTCLVSETLS